MADEPAESRPILSVFLTRDEWRLVYAYAWTARVLRCYGLEEISDGLFAELKNNEGLAMLWAIRKLVLKHGMKFVAVQVDPDYRVRLTRSDPVEPRNVLLVEKLARGKGLQYNALLDFAINHALALGLKDFDFEPMREALARVNDDLSAQRKERTPEDEKLIDDAMDYLLRIAGLQRADQKYRGDN